MEPPSHFLSKLHVAEYYSSKKIKSCYHSAYYCQNNMIGETRNVQKNHHDAQHCKQYDQHDIAVPVVLIQHHKEKHYCVTQQYQSGYSPGKCPSFPACIIIDYNQKHHCLQQPNTYPYRQVFQKCTEAGYAPDVLLCTSQVKTVKDLVTNDLGIAVLPNFVMRSDTTFSRRPLTPVMEVPVYLCWGAHKTLSQAEQKFIDFVKEYTESAEFKQHFRQE